MSNSRSIFLLLSGIVALAAAHYWLSRYERVTGSAARQTLIDPAVNCTEVVVERAGSPLVRLRKDRGWQLTEPFVAQADEQVVMKLIDAVSQLPILEMLKDSVLPRMDCNLDSLALSHPVLRLTLAGEFGRERLSFGRLTPSAEGIYAMVDGVSAVFVVPCGVLEQADLPAEQFRRRQLFSLDYEAIDAFDIKHGAGEMMFFSREGSEWLLAGQKVSASRVRKFLESLLTAEAENFIWPTGATNELAEISASRLAGFGLDPESTVTVTLKGPAGNGQLSFGKTAAEGKVYALAQNARAVVTVPAALREAVAGSARQFVDLRLFPVATRDEVAFFRIDDGEAVYAATRSGAEDWRLESPVAAPADPEQVEVLLGNVLSLTSEDVDESGVLVSLSTNAAAVKVSRARLLRGVEVCRLRSREILKVVPTQVRRLVRVAAASPEQPEAIVFNRESQSWNIEQAGAGAGVDAKGVDRVLKALSALTALRIEKLKVAADELDDYGLDRPFLKLAVDQETEGAFRRNLLLGSRTRDGYFATVGASDAVFVLSEKVVRELAAPLIEK